MKIYHMVIIFAVIFLTFVTISDIKTREYIEIQEERSFLDRCFDQATDTATRELIHSEKMTLVEKKELAVETFFISMETSLGISNQSYQRDKLELYVPFISILDETEFYIYYSDFENDSSGPERYVKRWSNRIPYSYEDDTFVYLFSLTGNIRIYDKGDFLMNHYGVHMIEATEEEIAFDDMYRIFRTNFPNHFILNKNTFDLRKKEAIRSQIERYLNYYVNKHNFIAREFGLSYKFIFPTIDESDWLRAINSSSMITLFQGYPLVSGDQSFYNRFSIAGAALRKKDLYYLEERDGYYIYHNYNCKYLKNRQTDIVCHSIQECASFGAYACSICNKNVGVHPPDQ